jgi:hypothetical protein
LTRHADRLAALAEAGRVLRPAGLLAAAAISRYAAVLDDLAFYRAADPVVVGMRDRTVVDGQYRNETRDSRFFVTAYFHRPEDLASELRTAGYDEVGVFGVEGPGWTLHDFDERWNDAGGRERLLRVAHLLEEEPSILGVSAHLLAIARKPGPPDRDARQGSTGALRRDVGSTSA